MMVRSRMLCSTNSYSCPVRLVHVLTTLATEYACHKKRHSLGNYLLATFALHLFLLKKLGRFGPGQGHFFDAGVGRWLKTSVRVPRRHKTRPHTSVTPSKKMFSYVFHVSVALGTCFSTAFLTHVLHSRHMFNTTNTCVLFQSNVFHDSCPCESSILYFSLMVIAMPVCCQAR